MGMGMTIGEINELKDKNKELIAKLVAQTKELEGIAKVGESWMEDFTASQNQVTVLRKALEFYKLDDEQSVEMQILENVDLRPATTALATFDSETENIDTICPCISKSEYCSNCDLIRYHNVIGYGRNYGHSVQCLVEGCIDGRIEKVTEGETESGEFSGFTSDQTERIKYQAQRITKWQDENKVPTNEGDDK